VQELGLEGQRQLRDFVQVERAALRVLELPGLAPMGPGEGPPLMPEQLGLEQIVRNRSAVDLDERPMARLECAWMLRATRSLPTPLSPRISTIASVSAMLSMIVRTARIDGLVSRIACPARASFCTEATTPADTASA